MSPRHRKAEGGGAGKTPRRVAGPTSRYHPGSNARASRHTAARMKRMSRPCPRPTLKCLWSFALQALSSRAERQLRAMRACPQPKDGRPQRCRHGAPTHRPARRCRCARCDGHIQGVCVVTASYMRTPRPIGYGVRSSSLRGMGKDMHYRVRQAIGGARKSETRLNEPRGRGRLEHASGRCPRPRRGA